MTASGWLEELRARSLADVAEALGLEVDEQEKGCGPCPSCGASERERTGDRRPPVNFFTRKEKERWSCKATGGGGDGSGCGAGGDAVALVAHVAVGEFPGKGSPLWKTVRAEGARLGLCSGIGGPAPPPRPVRPPAPLAPPKRPPADEVADLWRRARPVTQDRNVRAWLEARGLDAGAVEDLDLARALPVGDTVIGTSGKLPAWAALGRRSWATLSYGLIIPVFEADGRPASFRARLVGSPGDPSLKVAKELSPSPSGFESRGLVLADPLAQLMLKGEVLGDGTPASELVRTNGLIVTEGCPDFFLVATIYGTDAGLEGAPAVLGVFSGSWTEALAARVPDGTTVTLAAHGDATGEGYASAAGRTLAARCEVKRWMLPREVAT